MAWGKAASPPSYRSEEFDPDPSVINMQSQSSVSAAATNPLNPPPPTSPTASNTTFTTPGTPTSSATSYPSYPHSEQRLEQLLLTLQSQLKHEIDRRESAEQQLHQTQQKLQDCLRELEKVRKELESEKQRSWTDKSAQAFREMGPGEALIATVAVPVMAAPLAVTTVVKGMQAVGSGIGGLFSGRKEGGKGKGKEEGKEDGKENGKEKVGNDGEEGKKGSSSA